MLTEVYLEKKKALKNKPFSQKIANAFLQGMQSAFAWSPSASKSSFLRSAHKLVEESRAGENLLDSDIQEMEVLDQQQKQEAATKITRVWNQYKADKKEKEIPASSRDFMDMESASLPSHKQ